MKNCLRACFCLLAVSLTACDAGYFAHLALGELASLSRTIPVEQALSDSTLTEEEHRKLELAMDVRQFAIDHVGLNGDNAFTVFEANGTAPAAYVLSASDREALRPVEWDFPFVGRVAYKGFFDAEMVQREAEQLSSDGYDVFIGVADGFSTLGIFPDPIRQSNLQLEDAALAEFICHELTHATVFKSGDSDFNEAIGTFVGRAAAQAWFDATYGPDAAEAMQARRSFEDAAIIDGYVAYLYELAADYYAAAAARGESREQIIAGREAVFAEALSSLDGDYLPQLHEPDRWAFLLDQPIDNARILAGVRYLGGLSDFADVFDRSGGDFRAAIAVYREAASVEDSRSFLRAWMPPP